MYKGREIYNITTTPPKLDKQNPIKMFFFVLLIRDVREEKWCYRTKFVMQHNEKIPDYRLPSIKNKLPSKITSKPPTTKK
jgi:hypothetical protein